MHGLFRNRQAVCQQVRRDCATRRLRGYHYRTSPNSPSRQIAQFAAGLSLADVPAPVLTRAKLHILDALGLGIASTVQDYAASALPGSPR